MSRANKSYPKKSTYWSECHMAPSSTAVVHRVGYIMQTLSIFQDYQMNGMDASVPGSTTQPPRPEAAAASSGFMENSEMPNANAATDNKVNGGGRGQPALYSIYKILL